MAVSKWNEESDEVLVGSEDRIILSGELSVCSRDMSVAGLK
jgi:hypothetical protein